MPGFSVILRPREPDPDPKFTCRQCNSLLREPRQASCGHRYCKVCLEGLIRSGEGSFKCTSEKCEETIRLEGTFPDRIIQREVASLPIYCNNVDDGCTWEGVLGEMEAHRDECEYEKIACIHQECEEMVPRRNLSTHLAENCAFRSETCQWCKELHPSKDIANHQESCPMAPARCKWCGKKGLTRSQLQDHQHPQTGDCPNMKLPCNFEPVGCQEQRERTCDSPFLDGTKNKRTKPARGRGTRAWNLLWTRKSRNCKTKTKSQQHQDQAKMALENRVEQIGAKAEDAIKKLAAWEPRIGMFQGIVGVLSRESEKCSFQMQAYERQRRQDREIIETLERKVESLERIIALKDVNVAEQDLQTQTQEPISYDGILTWKIPDFTRKLHDAIAGKSASFYSPCFFTSRTGYKMCARIYLNGDGMGKGTHVSLFFVVMRGHYDGLLRWPFRQKVTFMLLDHNNREHVIDAFRPDPTSSSFQRPTSDMNIASGCPLFVPLSQLDSSSHAYVRDDTIYLRVIVDTSDLN